MADRAHWNRARFSSAAGGHYESYFQRANHPSEPRAFWIRYTVFSPRGAPADALGELWAIYFDGTRDRIVAVREARPIAECRFSASGLDVGIGAATLDQESLRGAARNEGHRIEWDLRYTSPDAPLLLLDPPLYERSFPKAKALVGSPHARYQGSIEVDGERVGVEHWIGSLNHNWGSQHTDAYAWGQVAGFDGAAEVFLECSTARVKVGPILSPPFTLVVLRLGGETLAWNTLGRALRARGSYGYFHWQFHARGGGARIHGAIEAPKSAFVGLTYLNPPGGSKTCLNTKLARCRVTLGRGGEAVTYTTQSRAAFEILTDDASHGVPVLGV